MQTLNRVFKKIYSAHSYRIHMNVDWKYKFSKALLAELS